MKYLIKTSFTLLFILTGLAIKAQRTAIYADQDVIYKQGLELFDKKQFASAQESFVEFSAKTKSTLLKEDATYYAAACGIELFNKDSEWLMREFIAKNPSSTRINSAWFYLGKSNFRKKKYDTTIEYLEKIDEYKLDKEQLAELYFKRGYSYLQEKNDEKAKADFYEIKDVENKYSAPAAYYYAHLAYKEKNYEIALQGFNKLVGNETFGSVVPYYITQIYFIQGKFEKVVKEAPKLLNDTAYIQKAGDINRMIGESYFNMKEYANALIYLKKTELGYGMNAQGNYVLGFCYYKMKDYTNAERNLQKATEGKDSVAQSAWYHMADCDIKLGEKLKAKNAFYSAYQLNFDKKITEDALFSFAKLSYELDFNPYNEAVKGFTKYINEYPKSPRKDEVYNFLINVYSTTKNYAAAVISMESIENMDPILKVTYQKLIYFRGVEFFNNGDLDNAEVQFKKSLLQNTDMALNSLSQYWLAEISYLRKNYTTAIEGWKKFQVTQGATSLMEYDLSNYAIGYAYFHRKDKDDYTNANISFRKFLLTKNSYDENKIADANIRTADAYFMNRDFIQASDYYKKAIALNKIDVDYSLYQKALCDGLNKNYIEKIAELKKIETRHPHSNYIVPTLNEIAETYYNNVKDEDNAILYYERILKNFPNSSAVNTSYAQLGNIYFNRKQDDKALEYFDKFVRTDAKSEAAKDVLQQIKKIFEAKGDVDAMTAYFASVGNPLSEDQIEKASYQTAYDAFYTDNNCDIAMPKWETYISKFPNGRHISEAQFRFAECAYSKSMFEKAIPSYQYIITRPRSVYSEVSLAKTSYLYYKDKKYAEALPLFQQLQEIAETPSNKSAGKFGAMRCAFYMKEYTVALNECTKVLNTEKLTPQETSEAKYIKAKSLYETKRLDDALIEFTAMTKAAKNVTGAEAYYYIGRIQFAKQDYKEVEKTINKLISYEYSNDDWNNKGMLLLADSYIALKDDANAQVVLESVIGAKIKQEYVDEANSRLAALKERQIKELSPVENKGATQQGNEMKVEFNQTKKDSALFNNEPEVIQVPAPTTTISEQPK
ncbi:tetratricopeptide repeat protein [Aurantibacillus circumpalustris]|uniref:tetratricopeptide repeat protein n=1 Tax=Aurantibacillus circumpalustris TaxID=3036359 RepID=UPI00295B0DED|nr:tetratricopeptide repeat protein [Aurantibacillus circumpalustris]